MQLAKPDIRQAVQPRLIASQPRLSFIANKCPTLAAIFDCVGQDGAIANKRNTPPGKHMEILYSKMYVFNSPVVLSCTSSMVSCEGTACGVTEKKRVL